MAESFFASLMSEIYFTESFATSADARHTVVEHIEVLCNCYLPHSAIGNQVPAENMAAFFERTERRAAKDSEIVANLAA